MSVQGNGQAAEPALLCEHVCVSYGGFDVLALEGVSLSLPRGARVGVLGPNGAGKSTLFKVAAGLLPLRHGKMLVRGKPAGTPGSELAYVPQREEVDWRFPVTVFDVVLMGRYGRLGLFRRPGAADRAAVQAALDLTDLREHAQTRISDLSGGQQQRVFLARAIAQDSDILMLDEPFNGVDARTEAALFAVLDRLRAQGVSVIIATHDLNKARSHFDYLLFLRHGLVAFGPPAEVFTPQVLRDTFGEQLTLWPGDEGTLAVADGHCGDHEHEHSHTHVHVLGHEHDHA